MGAPCRRCGTTKTEPVRRGLRPKLAQKLGYDLRKCARCRKLRLISRRPPPWAAAPGNAPFIPFELATSPVAPQPTYDPDGFNGCPRCGEPDYHPAGRNWFERVLLRQPPMARCVKCRYRFPVPQV